MPWYIMTIIIFGTVLLLLFMGIPVAAGLGLGGIIVAYFFLGQVGIVSYAPWTAYNSFILTTIPLFIFMGEVLLHGKISQRLYDGSTALVGRFPGGLLHANIFSCAIFAAISGSSVATAATMGTIAIPELEKRGYETKIVLGSLAAGGTLGILIPPSITMIVYGVIVEASIGKLFIGGIFPGIMLASLFMIYIAIRVKIQPGLAPPYERLPLKQRLLSVIGMWPIFLIMVIILGGIYMGVITPTEAAAIGASIALILTLVYRNMTWSILQQSLLSALKTSTMVIFIIVGALIVSGILNLLRVPGGIAIWIAGTDLPPILMISLIYLMYIFLGCFFHGMAMMIVTLPIVFPIILALGYDPIWFGIVIVMLVEMAALTPPVGLNLYTIHGLRPDRPISEVIIGSFPFFLVQIVGLSVVTAFPQIATWLPSTMSG